MTEKLSGILSCVSLRVSDAFKDDWTILSSCRFTYMIVQKSLRTASCSLEGIYPFRKIKIRIPLLWMNGLFSSLQLE